MTQYKSLQPINLCWVLWDGPSEYEIRWETHRSMPFLSDDWPTLWCSSVLWSSYRVFFCTEGPSMMNRMPMDALQFNIRYIISSNPTMTILCKKRPGVNEQCASVWWLQGMSRYVSLLLFRMPVDAEHGLLGTSPGLPMEFRNFPWNMGSSYRFSLKPQRKWGFHHGPLGSARLPRWLPGQWRKRPQGPKSTTFPGRQGLEVVNSHGYDPSHGATPDHHPSHQTIYDHFSIESYSSKIPHFKKPP